MEDKPQPHQTMDENNHQQEQQQQPPPLPSHDAICSVATKNPACNSDSGQQPLVAPPTTSLQSNHQYSMGYGYGSQQQQQQQQQQHYQYAHRGGTVTTSGFAMPWLASCAPVVTSPFPQPQQVQHHHQQQHMNNWPAVSPAIMSHHHHSLPLSTNMYTPNAAAATSTVMATTPHQASMGWNHRPYPPIPSYHHAYGPIMPVVPFTPLGSISSNGGNINYGSSSAAAHPYVITPANVTTAAASNALASTTPKLSTDARLLHGPQTVQTTPMAKATAKTAPLLATHPCQAPSPFAKTHVILKHTITLMKRPTIDASFGVQLQLELASALVDPIPSPAPLAVVQQTFKAEPTFMASNAVTTGPEKVATVDADQSAVAGSNVGAPDGGSENPNASTRTANPLAPYAVDTAATTIGPQQPPLMQPQPVPRRPRRRRVFFSVVMVLDATEQNQRHSHNSSSDSNNLQQGDILLTIAGRSTCGLSFMQACLLFKEHAIVGDDGITRCDVTVARRLHSSPLLSLKKPKLDTSSVAPSKLALSSTSTATPDATPLDPTELLALCVGRLRALTDPRRVLGEPFNDSLLCTILVEQGGPLSMRCDSELERQFLHQSWFSLSSQVDVSTRQKAVRHWKQQWSLEAANIQATIATTRPKKSYWTDAQRCAARAAPKRKPNQCKCSSKDHEYVNDMNCPLYSNLRKFLDQKDNGGKDNPGGSQPAAIDATVLAAVDVSSAVPAAQRSLSKKLVSQGRGDLNVVEKAFANRVVRANVETKAGAAEATFVALMETIQMTKCGQAIVAPSLTVMVLSAVVELLQTEYSKAELTPWASRPDVPRVKPPPTPLVPVIVEAAASTVPSAPPANKTAAEDDDDSDDDDDDDIPLAALGKRPREDETKPTPTDVPLKSISIHRTVRPHFLAKLLSLLSKKWGHVYREASHEDYTWRWEIFHGQVSECGSPWNTYSNPRVPGSLGLENVRFTVNEHVAAQLERFEAAPENVSNVQALTILGHMLAPKSTGVMDELDALVTTKVLFVDERGIPALTKDWWKNVDLLVLDEMHNSWGIDADPTGRFGVAETIRKMLYRKWTCDDLGWALNSDVEDIVYDFEEFDEWRMAFIDKLKARSDNVDGIGKFR